jgi:hypothetical protein
MMLSPPCPAHPKCAHVFRWCAVVARSGNPCLCGGAPGWLTPFLAAPATTNSTNTTSNGTTSTDHTSILQPCGPQADLICGQSLWGPEFLQDAAQLLLLKAAAANTQTTQRLDTWRGSVPPCTNSSVNASCAV